MRFKIEKLTRKIQEINIVRQQQEPQRLGYQTPTPDSDSGLTLREIQADKNYEAWRSSVEHLVAAAATLYEPDEQSIANRGDLSSWGDPNEPSILDENNSTEMADNLSSVIETGCGFGVTIYQGSGLTVSDNGSDWDLDHEVQTHSVPKSCNTRLQKSKRTLPGMLILGYMSKRNEIRRKESSYAIS